MEEKNAVNNRRLISDEGSSSLETSGKTVRPAHALPRDQMEEDQEEKARLIAQVLELQNTLDGWLMMRIFRYSPYIQLYNFHFVQLI